MRTTRDVGCKIRSFSREVEEEMDIAARIGVEEGVYAVVGGVAAAGFLHAQRCFDVDLLVGVIVVEVIHPGDEVPEPGRVGEVNLAAELSVGAFRQDVVRRIHGLEHAAAAAQRGGAVGGVIAAIDREPIVRHYGSVDAGLNGRAALMRSAERSLVLGWLPSDVGTGFRRCCNRDRTGRVVDWVQRAVGLVDGTDGVATPVRWQVEVSAGGEGEVARRLIAVTGGESIHAHTRE